VYEPYSRLTQKHEHSSLPATNIAN